MRLGDLTGTNCGRIISRKCTNLGKGSLCKKLVISLTTADGAANLFPMAMLLITASRIWSHVVVLDGSSLSALQLSVNTSSEETGSTAENDSISWSSNSWVGGGISQLSQETSLSGAASRLAGLAVSGNFRRRFNTSNWPCGRSRSSQCP